MVSLVLASVANAAAQTAVTLAWNANTEPDIAGYALYYGTTTGTWPTAVDVGNTTQHTVNGLTRGSTYYFIVRAYNTDGLYSGPSAEVSAQIPYIDGSLGTTEPGLELMYQHTDGRLVSLRFSSFTQVGIAEQIQPALTDPRWTVVGFGDFDRDGRRDILWQHQDASLAIWLMNGNVLRDGAMVNPANPGSIDWRAVGVGDFDGDGYPDILFRHRLTDDMAVWLLNRFNLRDGAMLSPVRVNDPRWRIASIADLDGDSMVDVIWQHADGSLAAWLMDRWLLKDGASLTPNRPPDANWTVVGTGRGNGDAMADLVWRHNQTGAVAIWLMNRFTLIDGASLTMFPVGSGWRLVATR
jgi:hypothetical protein